MTGRYHPQTIKRWEKELIGVKEDSLVEQEEEGMTPALGVPDPTV